MVKSVWNIFQRYIEHIKVWILHHSIVSDQCQIIQQKICGYRIQKIFLWDYSDVFRDKLKKNLGWTLSNRYGTNKGYVKKKKESILRLNLNLGTINIWNWIITCYGWLSYVLEDYWLYFCTLPPRCHSIHPIPYSDNRNCLQFC